MSKILVIDDSRLARRAMRKILEREGHEIVDVDRAAQGLELLEGQDFDCVTVDVLMPDMTGIEFLEQINSRAISVPVIVVTADIQKTTQTECLERGAQAVVAKPVDTDTLNAHIAAASAARRSAPAAITSDQRDALTELVNVGVGRAAAALNDIVEGHVELKVPEVELVDVHRLGEALGGQERDTVSSVQMGFGGSLDGLAFLVFPRPSAVKLVELVTDEALVSGDLDCIHASSLTEIGNIVISAVMGTIANVLDKSLVYSLPVYEQESVLDLLAHRRQDDPTILIARTSFTIRRTTTIEGWLLLLFELQSRDALLSSLEEGS